MSPEKPPMMGRLSLSLQKHGLSFSDALNIALFLLTIVSLVVALIGVKLAKDTLTDARTQAGEARTQAAQATADSAQAATNQRAEFHEQMKELRASNDALEKTSTLLSHQSKILRGLQNISSQQLKDLNAAEARSQKHEQARPILHIEGYCKDNSIFYVSEKDFPPAPFARAYGNSVTMSKPTNMEWPRKVRHRNCYSLPGKATGSG